MSMKVANSTSVLGSGEILTRFRCQFQSHPPLTMEGELRVNLIFMIIFTSKQKPARSRMGFLGQDSVQANIFWGFLWLSAQIGDC